MSRLPLLNRSAFAAVLVSLAAYGASGALSRLNGQGGPVPLAAGGVEVTPDGGADPGRAPSGSYSTTFQVKNAGTFQYTFNLTCTRTGQVSTCAPDEPQITLSAGATGNVVVEYTTGAVGTGVVKLKATQSGGGISDTGWVNVTVLPTGKVQPFFVRREDNIDRGLCLTVGAGEAAGLSCGDLFVVQGMPAYRTLGKDRSLALYYNSASATALTLVPAWFRRPSAVAPATSYEVLIDINGTKDSVLYGPGNFPVSCGLGCTDTLQVVAGKTLALGGLATGSYPVSLRFRAIYPADVQDTIITGNVLVLNRSASEYGRGWSLLGVEQLVIPADPAQRIWVAGDGSMRVYQQGVGLTSGMLRHSGLTSFSATNSVDGNTATLAWQTTSSTPTTAFVQESLGVATPKAVTSVRVYADNANNATYDVQYSANGASWTSVVTGFKPQAGWSSVVWSAVGAYTFWRLKVATTNPSGTSSIRELSFGSANNFYGAPGDAPDSLLQFTNLGQTWYRRWLKHGAKVEFDQTGRHRTTTNRVGAVTSFYWAGTPVRLDSIVVPPVSAPSKKYILKWNATTKLLDSIYDPGGRGLRATLTSGNLVKLRAPAGLDSTRFAYDVRNVMIKRIASRQRNSTKGDSAFTIYTYANNARVTKVEVQADSAATQFTTTTVTPWDERGFTALVKVGSLGLATRVDGPLAADTSDAVDFWPDPFGQLRRSRHVGLGTVTVVSRDSINSLPALPTKVQFPHDATPGGIGRIVRLSWNPRGNLTQQLDSTFHLDGIVNRTVTYLYDSTASAPAPDSPIRVTDPLNRQINYFYRTTDPVGLLDYMVDARGHRTDFTYRTDALKGLVRSVTERNVPTWQDTTLVPNDTAKADTTDALMNLVRSFEYDANGNLKWDSLPSGVRTSYVADALGRITEVHSPTKTLQAFAFDPLNRLVSSTAYTDPQPNYYGINPLAGCDANQHTCVDSTMNVTLPPTITSVFRQTPSGMDSVVDHRQVTRKFTYDAKTATRRETDDYGVTQKAFFGVKGLLDSTLTRAGLTIKHVYDLYGRLTQTVLPARGPVPADTCDSPTISSARC